MIFDCKIVETLIIDTKAKTAIKLFVKKDESFSGRLKRPNKTRFKVSFDVYLQNLGFH